MFKKIFSTFMIFGSVMLALSGCEQKVEKLKGTVTISTSVSVASALLWVAEKQGYFAEEGVEVKLQKFSTGKAAFESMEKGKAELSTLAEFAAVKKSKTCPKLKLLASMSEGESDIIVARSDRGIQKVEDLKGKKIGLTIGTKAEFNLHTLLRIKGLKISDVEIVNLKPLAMVEALKTGAIDAGISFRYWAYKMRKGLKDQAVTIPAQQGRRFYFLLAVQEDWLEQHSEHAQRVINALVKADKWVMNHHEQFHNDYLKGVFQRPEEYLEELHKNQDFILRLSQSLVSTMNLQRRFLEKSGYFKDENIYPVDLIYSDFLKKANPDSVELIE